MRQQLEEDLGPVDILVNNAGLMPAVSLLEGRVEDIEKVMNVNVISHFLVCSNYNRSINHRVLSNKFLFLLIRASEHIINYTSLKKI